MSNTNKNSFSGNSNTPRKRKIIIVTGRHTKNNSLQFLSAPYNFVGLNEKVLEAYPSAEDLPDPGKIEKDLLTGEIIYRITAETPLVFEHGMHTLTASTVRGLVKSNLQILGFSSVYDDIADTRNRYRDFGDSYYKNLMTETSTSGRQINSKVYAGIIFRNSEGIFIKPGTAFGGIGFCRLNIERIQRSDPDWRKNFNVSFAGVKNVFDALSQGVSLSRTQMRSKNIREAFIKEVSWKSGRGQGVEGVGEKGVFNNKGWLVNPGYMYSSKSYYLIPCQTDATENDLIRLPREETNAYREYINQLSRKAGSNRRGDFYDLPDLNVEKPVFYILHDGKCEFGFTKQFPISWKYSVRKGIPVQHGEMKIDYSMALFGFNGARRENGHSQLSYGGRLAFMPPVKRKERTDVTADLLLLPPSTSSCRCYIHDDKGMGYNSETFMVNGIKQYWLQNEVLSSSTASPTVLTPVSGESEGTVYEGTVRFYNLRDDELGLLLWSIGLNKNCRQNIGAGKPYGYGRIALDILEVRRIQYSLCHFQTGPMPVPDQLMLDPDAYIQIYQERLNRFLNGQLARNKRLQDFFTMKDIKYLPDQSKIQYEELSRFRFREISFPKITDLVKNQVWLILPDSAMQEIFDISWEQFSVDPPSELENLYPEKEIFDAYRELAEGLELFGSNRNYYIRQDILLEYYSLSERVRGLLNRKEKRSSASHIPCRYEAIERNMNICISEIRSLMEKMELVRKQFEKEGLPVLRTEIVRSSRIDNNDCAEIVLKMEISESSSLIRVNSICFLTENNDRTVSSQKFFISGGEPCESLFRIPLSGKETEQSSYVQLNLQIEYQFIRDSKPVKTLYENQIEVSLLAGDFQELKNPYSSWLGNPVAEWDMFFGRDELMKEILQKIESCSRESLSGRNIVIHGQKRTGKSTVLYFLKQTLQACENYLVIDIGNVGSVLQIESDGKRAGRVRLRQFFRRMINLAEDAICENYESLYNQLEEEGVEFPSLRNVTDAEAMDVCEQFYRNLSARLMPDQRIVLLIDEFTYFYDMIVKEYMDQNFMQFWKAFIQNTKICAVLVGQDYMDDFRNRFANEFGASDFLRLTYLDTASTRKMICQPFAMHNGYDGFTENCVREITRLTAGSAYYVMHMCSGLVSYVNEKRTGKIITASILTEFLRDRWMNVDSARRIDRAFFEALYNDGMHPEWDDDNLVILHEIAVMDQGEGAVRDELINRIENTVAFVREKIQRLGSREVISEKQGRLHIRVGLFQKWLREIY